MEKVQIGNATLYRADCMEVLPGLGKVDSCVTDPPYGIGHVMKGGSGTGHWSLLSNGNHWDEKAPCLDFMMNCADNFVIWGGNYFPLLPSRCWLVWDKENAVPTMGQCELAWTNIDHPIQRKKLPVGRNNFGHPTEKPIELMKWCINFINSRIATYNNSIIDPFMGSGTTGVACASMGKTFIGIEREQQYFDISCKRIEEAYKQPDMFIMPEKPLERRTADMFHD